MSNNSNELDMSPVDELLKSKVGQLNGVIILGIVDDGISVSIGITDPNDVLAAGAALNKFLYNYLSGSAVPDDTKIN